MSLLNLLISAGKAFSAGRRRERVYAELMALDDRSLADIGIIHRLQICALAESARKRTEFPMNNFTPWQGPRLDAPPGGRQRSHHMKARCASPTGRSSADWIVTEARERAKRTV